MTEMEDPLEPIIAALKEPVVVSPHLARRVMSAIESPPMPLRWWQRRWTVQVSPLGALAAAAALMVVVFGGREAGRRAEPPEVPVAATARTTQFLLVAPDAAAVTVVGDFNDWSAAGTPLSRTDERGVWWVTIPLAPGRYRYAFVVDGVLWRPDPEAPAVDDEFGRPSSVVTIGGA